MSTVRITFRDWLIRTWLDIKMNLRYLFKVKRVGKFVIPQEYKQVFSDDFQADFREKWDTGAEQGVPPYHPANLIQWYDNDQILLTPEGVQFSAVVRPKYFPEIDTTIPNAIGTMRTKDSWKYGIFEFNTKMPSGYWLWQALWLSGRWNWPPEIDLLEGYSKDTVDFNNNKNQQSNVHIDDGNGGTLIAGARTHRLPNEVTKNFIKYVIWWEPDFIKIYYNGYLVRKITGREVLNGMSEEQRVIIGTGVEEGFYEDNITPMIVSDVKVFQK